MDITLVRTFLEVAATGSFVAASDRLFVTQSAVSLRVQRLEDSLGQTLFTRSKAGAEMTPAGRAFETYALSMLKLWEEARQQVGLPEGFDQSLTIGAQYSLWPQLGFGWIDRLRAERPTLNIRTELGMPDRLTRFLTEGVVSVALMYMPQIRPGLVAQRVMEEELVLVSAKPATLDEIAATYVFVDWGPEFIRAHALELPHLVNTGLTFALAALSTEYIVTRGRSAYLPARSVTRHLDSGALHLVPDAPRFPYPVWAIWREDIAADLRSGAEAALGATVARILADQDRVMTDLAGISSGPQIEVLGEASALSVEAAKP
ncbi:LysR family transcriptional regulator [Pseudaestuariivita sp.]|uniref:LysR family transcriptional regulator n=1 Tax=Pseudaestuariivita sp. TaxID=2211669 RepID=UPI004059BDA3